MTAYKNVVFDFGKVLVHFEPEYMTAQYIKDKEDVKLVSSVLFDRLYWDRLDAGTITDLEVVSESCKRLPEKFHKDVEKIYDNWMYNIPEIDGMREILQQLKEEGTHLFLLSNISETFANRSDTIPVLKYFEKCIFSAKAGCVKPSEQIFRYLLCQCNINAQDTLFVDDSIINIEGAKKVGINTYHFDGDVKKLKSFLFK